MFKGPGRISERCDLSGIGRSLAPFGMTRRSPISADRVIHPGFARIANLWRSCPDYRQTRRQLQRFT